MIVDLLFESLQLGAQLDLLGLDLGAPVLDVLDELLVGLVTVVAGDFERADQALLSGVEVCDRLLDRRDPFVPCLLNLPVQVAQS